MARRVPKETRLERLLKVLGIHPLHVVAEAKLVARRLGLRESISRQHLGRLRLGRNGASEAKIRLLVGTLRTLTGLSIRAGDLFDIEPAIAGVPLTDPSHGGTRRLSLFSSPGWPGAWRFLVDEDRPSAAQTLEVLYREHSALLRANARRRFRIPEDDIEALVHDVFASFLERQPRVDDVRAFLIGATNNACKHYWRKRQRETPLLPEHEQTADSSTERELERWTLFLSLGATLARLGTNCRETLRRYYLREEKPDSIARHLDTTPAYIFQLLSTCRKRARQIFRDLTEPKR